MTALKEGYQQVQIYFILADESGQMTSANGEVKLTLTEEPSYGSGQSRTLFTRYYSVAKSDFQTTTVGQGSFAHEVLLCNIGRIPYSRFSAMPTQFSGKVDILFTPTGDSPIKGEDTVLFDK